MLGGKKFSDSDVRLRFRDEGRTLRHEEVDGQMEDVVNALTTSCGAEIRS